MSTLLYRVESPASKCQFVADKGILSHRARVALVLNSDSAVSEFPATFPSAEHVENTDELVKHLRMDAGDFVTPFISTSKDFWRIFSIAAKLVWVDKIPAKDIKLYVICQDYLNSWDVLDAYRFLAQLSTKNKRRIVRFDQVFNTIKVNNEMIVRRMIPEAAILSTNTLEDILPVLPAWMKSDDLSTITPYPTGYHWSYVRAWNKEVDAKRKSDNEDLNVSDLVTRCLGWSDNEKDRNNFERMIKDGPKLV